MAAEEGYEKLDESNVLPSPSPPSCRDFFIVVSSIIVCLTNTGLAFGFSALVPSLLKIGAFHDRCDTLKVCHQQVSCLTGMFSMTTSLLNIAALPSGAILDHCGPRATGTFFCMVVAVGCVIFSQGPANELAYTFGFLLFGVSGPCIFNCTLSFGNLFPARAGLVTAALVGSFDASSAVFVALSLALQSGLSFGVTFSGFAVIPALGAVMALAWPKAPVEMEDEDFGDEMPQRSVQSICSGSEFWMLAYTVSVTMVCINFFIATAFAQMLHVTDSIEEAEKLNSAFAVFLPAGGIVFIPLIGLVLDRLGPTLGYFILQSTYGLFVLLMLCFYAGGGRISAIAAFACFAFCRPFFYSLLPAFCGQRFGFTHFGTIFGLLISISGFCNFGVQTLTTLASLYGFRPVNSLLGLLQLSTVVLPLLVLAKDRKKIKPKLLEKATEHERVRQKSSELDDGLLRSFSIRSFSMK